MFISHLISQLISNGEHLFSDISHQLNVFRLCPLLSSIHLSIAECTDNLVMSSGTSIFLSVTLTLLERRTVKLHDLSVDIHLPLAWCHLRSRQFFSTLLTYLTYFHSSLTFNSEHLFSDISHLFVYAHYYRLSVCLLQDTQMVSHHTLGKMFSISEISVDIRYSQLMISLVMSVLLSSPGMSHLISQLTLISRYLWWWTFILWHISPILFMPITSCILYLSVYCRMCGLSRTLGKKFSKAELSVDIHHPLADNFTGCISSSQLSWHISPTNFPAHLCIYSPTFLICFVYAHYYLLSVCLLQDACHGLLARCSAYLRSLLMFITS